MNLGKTMKDQIEQTVQAIIGMPMWSIGRAANLEWFLFGNEYRSVPAKKTGYKLVSDYSLHVQCAWRIRNHERIIIASRDRNYPTGEDPYKDIEEFEWDTRGGNRLDERVSKLLEERADNPLIVLSVLADEAGGLLIAMSEGFLLEVFSDDSLLSERWRFFRPYSENEHFVVTGHGIEIV